MQLVVPVRETRMDSIMTYDAAGVSQLLAQMSAVRDHNMRTSASYPAAGAAYADAVYAGAASADAAGAIVAALTPEAQRHQYLGR